MAGSPVVAVDRLWCAHDYRFVLRDVSFDVHEGEIAVIVGVNGVGKSTLLATMAGALSAVRGQVRVFGHPRRTNVDSEREARRLTAWLPDAAWLPGAMQVTEYLGASAALFDIPPGVAIERIDSLLDLFSLSTARSQSLDSLSTGQKKKVGLCSALLSDRKLLLLDEPFSGGLDPAGITALRRVLKHRAGKQVQTIVLTTPVAEVVAELADRLLVLQSGSLSHNLGRAELHQLLIAPRSRADALDELIFPDAEQRIQHYLQHAEHDHGMTQGDSRSVS